MSLKRVLTAAIFVSSVSGNSAMAGGWKIGGSVGHAWEKGKRSISTDGAKRRLQGLANKLADNSHAADYNDCVVIVSAGIAVAAAGSANPVTVAVGAGSGVAFAGIACRRVFP